MLYLPHIFTKPASYLLNVYCSCVLSVVLSFIEDTQQCLSDITKQKNGLNQRRTENMNVHFCDIDHCSGDVPPCFCRYSSFKLLGSDLSHFGCFIVFLCYL